MSEYKKHSDEYKLKYLLEHKSWLSSRQLEYVKGVNLFFEDRGVVTRGQAEVIDEIYQKISQKLNHEDVAGRTRRADYQSHRGVDKFRKRKKRTFH